jgi:hypothetical protein
MDRRGRTAAVACGRAVVLAAAALLTGCTMCPDPYDYSGPVPNGSAPQNDFRARSGGILPLGAAPLPWPPIVKHGGAKGGEVQVARRRSAPARNEPTLADSDGAARGEPEAPVEPTSVLVIAEQEEPAAPEPAAAPLPVADPPTMVEVPAPLVEAEPAVELSLPVVASPTPEPPSPAVEPPPPAVEVPRLAETPGWRPRQAR